MPQIYNQIKMGSGENYKYIIDGKNAAVGDIEKYLKSSSSGSARNASLNSVTLFFSPST